MARPLRIEFPNAWYHVMNRGAKRAPIYHTDNDRTAFLNILSDVVETFHIEIHAYCLMGNHYHLLVKTPQGNLGQAMRHLNGVYTQRFNFCHRTDGPLFRGRYKAILVDADCYLAQVTRYIHLNPVEAKIAATPADYPWSSCQFFSKEIKEPPWLTIKPTLQLFGVKEKARENYVQFLSEGVDTTTKEFYEKERRGPILGDENFRNRIPKDSTEGKNDSEVPEKKHLHNQIPIATITEKVAEEFGLHPDLLVKNGRGRREGSLARMVAMALCRRPGGHKLMPIGESFQCNYSAVSSAGKQFFSKLKKDAPFSKKMNLLSAKIFNYQFKT